MARVRVGVIGCGSVGEFAYIPDLAASPHVDLAALCDVDEGRVRRVAAQYGVPAWYADPDALIARGDIELLVNLTPMPLHGPLNLKALQGGCHVFCEKPLAATLEEGQRLLDEAERRGLQLYGAPNAVISPTFRAAADAIVSREIGKVAVARGRYGSNGPHATWFYQAGGGSLFDLGVYNVVTLTGLLGPAKGVMAVAGVSRPRRLLDGEEITVEADDNTVVLIDFGEAVYGIVQTGFVYPMYAGHRGMYDDRVTIEILGSDGAINWLGYDWAPRGIEISTASRERETRATDQHGYTWQCGASYIARCMVEGTPPLMTAAHAYHTLEVMLAALESARHGRRVEITSTFPWPLVTPATDARARSAVAG